MYLKDCIVYFDKDFEKSYPFGRRKGKQVLFFNDVGLLIWTFENSYPLSSILKYIGTPISDRDYRLAIARALALIS